MQVAYILPGSKNGNVTVAILVGDLTSSVHYRELKFFCQTDRLASFVAMNKCPAPWYLPWHDAWFMDGIFYQ